MKEGRRLVSDWALKIRRRKRGALIYLFQINLVYFKNLDCYNLGIWGKYILISFWGLKWASLWLSKLFISDYDDKNVFLIFDESSVFSYSLLF